MAQSADGELIRQARILIEHIADMATILKMAHECKASDFSRDQLDFIDSSRLRLHSILFAVNSLPR